MHALGTIAYLRGRDARRPHHGRPPSGGRRVRPRATASLLPVQGHGDRQPPLRRHLRGRRSRTTAAAPRPRRTSSRTSPQRPGMARARQGPPDQQLQRLAGPSTPSRGRRTYFGDRSIADFGVRVDTDSTCSRPTNTFLHLIRDDIGFTLRQHRCRRDDDLRRRPDADPRRDGLPPAEQGPERLRRDDLLRLEDTTPAASSVGCNDVLGYTTVTFRAAASRSSSAGRCCRSTPTRTG